MSDRGLQLSGWVLFILCALFYTVDSYLNGSWLGFTGSLIFLVACFLFMIPLLRK